MFSFDPGAGFRINAGDLWAEPGFPDVRRSSMEQLVWQRRKQKRMRNRLLSMCGCRLKLRSKSAQPGVWVMDCNALVGEVDFELFQSKLFRQSVDLWICFNRRGRIGGFILKLALASTRCSGRESAKGLNRKLHCWSIFYTFFYIKSCRVGFNEDSGFSKRICRLVEVEEVDEEKEEKVDEE